MTSRVGACSQLSSSASAEQVALQGLMPAWCRANLPVEQFKNQEACVSLVEAEHRNVTSQGRQCSPSVHSEHGLLGQTVLPVTAVEPISDSAVELDVGIDVCNGTVRAERVGGRIAWRSGRSGSASRLNRS